MVEVGLPGLLLLPQAPKHAREQPPDLRQTPDNTSRPLWDRRGRDRAQDAAAKPLSGHPGQSYIGMLFSPSQTYFYCAIQRCVSPAAAINTLRHCKIYETRDLICRAPRQHHVCGTMRHMQAWHRILGVRSRVVFSGETPACSACDTAYHLCVVCMCCWNIHSVAAEMLCTSAALLQ